MAEEQSMLEQYCSMPQQMSTSVEELDRVQYSIQVAKLWVVLLSLVVQVYVLATGWERGTKCSRVVVSKPEDHFVWVRQSLVQRPCEKESLFATALEFLREQLLTQVSRFFPVLPNVVVRQLIQELVLPLALPLVTQLGWQGLPVSPVALVSLPDSGLVQQQLSLQVEVLLE
jgi:hypothetical protein